ncbi:hypothetical protein Dimus_029789 [Dionaea muscipula]
MEGSVFCRPRGLVVATCLSSISMSLSPLRHYIIGDYGDYEELRSDADSDDGSAGDGSFSKPFLAFDVIWNMAFVVVSVGVLLWTLKEKPSAPLRVWISGYALQCLLHAGLVAYEFHRRINQGDDADDGGGFFSPSSRTHSSILKKLEAANTMASSVWWVLGFYWIWLGGIPLVQDSPCLYWLTVVYLALDVCIVIVGSVVVCVICLAVFCCIPIIAIAYAMTIREGATEEDIKVLPKYKFRQSYASRRMSASDLKQEADGHAIESGTRDYPNELSFHQDDSECCICLAQYVEGAEICTLPCNHHYHYQCISKWLRINATCPLCKFNILGYDTLV